MATSKLTLIGDTPDGATVWQAGSQLLAWAHDTGILFMATDKRGKRWTDLGTWTCKTRESAVKRLEWCAAAAETSPDLWAVLSA
jgi:hypothetical protein